MYTKRSKKYDRNRKKYLRLMRRCSPQQLLYCVYCGRGPLYVGKSKGRPKERRLTIDHFEPVVSGVIEDHDMTNFVVSCRGCNNKKGTISGRELEKWIHNECRERRETLRKYGQENH